MTQTVSLSELKAQNAEAESTEVEEVEEEIELTETVEAEEVENSEESEEETEEPAEEESEESEHIEDWMKPDDESEGDGFKPNSLAASLRRKSKEKLAKKDEEIETLRQELESLKQGATAKPVQGKPIPKLEDFDYDEGKHSEAVAEWVKESVKSDLDQDKSKSEQQRQIEAQKRKIESSLETHYNAAAKLIESGTMTEEQYANAEGVLTREIETIFPDKGDQLVSSIIDTLNELGEGSEKVTYMLGVNKSKREKLLDMLRRNPASPAVAAYLGQLTAIATMPAKRKSSAPKPATPIKAGGKGKAESLYQSYKKMDAGPARVSFKRKAARDGVDVSKW